LSNRELSRLLGVSESTLLRRFQAGGALNRDEAERAWEVARVLALGLEVFEVPEDLRAWLREANTALGGREPLVLLDSTIGREEVRNLLGRIQWGIFS
ncbi:MAG: antitoxin Xre/MbcA/ParS toxin-binding domain-containing protein, partial [Catalinimonas sp.]